MFVMPDTPLTPAQRAAAYRARQRGIGPPKRQPGPKPTTVRGLREQVGRLQYELQQSREREVLASRHRSGIDRVNQSTMDRLQELTDRNAELEHLVRTGYVNNPRGTGAPMGLPLSAEELADLRTAKRDDDIDLARDILLDAFERWNGR